MTHPSQDNRRVHLRVVDLNTGQEVDRPDVAAQALSAFDQAISAAGGKLTIEGVELGTSQAVPLESSDE